MQTFSCLVSTASDTSMLRSRATADGVSSQNRKNGSLPGATVSGEPVRGGVAGTFLGGSGGGAAKTQEARHYSQFSP